MHREKRAHEAVSCHESHLGKFDPSLAGPLAQLGCSSDSNTLSVCHLATAAQQQLQYATLLSQDRTKVLMANYSGLGSPS